MEQADFPVAKVVRREGRNASLPTGFRYRGPERVRSAVREQSRVRVAELAMRKRRLYRVRERVRKVNPERASRLRRLSAETDSTTRLVVVPDASRVDCRDAVPLPRELVVIEDGRVVSRGGRRSARRMSAAVLDPAPSAPRCQLARRASRRRRRRLAYAVPASEAPFRCHGPDARTSRPSFQRERTPNISFRERIETRRASCHRGRDSRTARRTARRARS